MKEILPAIIKEINSKKKGNKIALGKEYFSLKISSHNFHQLNCAKGGKIAFIDGGNQEIIGGANFSLQLIRTYYCIYCENQRISKKTKEYFVLIRVVEKEGKLVYSIKNFSGDENFGEYSLYEHEHKIKAAEIGEKIRKLIEIKTIKEIIQLLDTDDIIVRDGDLEAQNDNEWLELERIYDASLKKNVIICGLSKTNHIITNTGESAVVMLKEKMPSGKWNCYPIVKSLNKEHKAEIAFVKLHDLSDYVFRFDIYQKQKEKIKEVLCKLCSNSCDPIFLGYPYGLIDADKFARVTNTEIEYYQMQLFIKGEEKIKNYIKGTDAHSVLDSIG